MPRIVYFMTHPNVLALPDLAVPQWPLSERGLARMRRALGQPWIGEITAIYCSAEQKARDGARILAHHLSLAVRELEELGENDRSATGFLPPEAFEAAADRFFAQPGESFSGWETAAAAQQRITRAVDRIVRRDATAGAIAIVSHGAVGTLLFCALSGCQIDRKWDQPPNGGGNYFAFVAETGRVLHGWKPIDLLPEG